MCNNGNVTGNDTGVRSATVTVPLYLPRTRRVVRVPKRRIRTNYTNVRLSPVVTGNGSKRIDYDWVRWVRSSSNRTRKVHYLRNVAASVWQCRERYRNLTSDTVG